MKVLNAVVALAILAGSSSVFANTVKACRQVKGLKGQTVIEQVVFDGDTVTLSYIDRAARLRDDLSGTLAIAELVKSGSKITITHLTLHNGMDGWMDDVKIEITPKTLNVQVGDDDDSKPSPRVRCPRS